MTEAEALAAVVATGLPVSFVTLDLTAQALVTPAVVERLASTREGAGQGACLEAACAILRNVPASRRFGQRGFPLHDPCAVALALWPDLFVVREAWVEVECGTGIGRGRTHIDRWNRMRRTPNIRIAERLEPERFFAALAGRLASLP